MASFLLHYYTGAIVDGSSTDMSMLSLLTGKGSGPSCMTNPSITCVSMWGFTMARCLSTG